MKILIVDDKEDSRYMLKTLLIGNNYQVEEAANGVQALEKLQDDGFDLIISDILMPDMDGFHLCRKVKADEALYQIPIVFYTATYTGPEDEEFALKAGANKFIHKPCEPDVFMEAIRNVMEAPIIGRTAPKGLEEEIETQVLYSERLVRKLEHKMLEMGRQVEARRKAEDALSISKTRLELALRSSNVGLWDWNLQTNDVWFSPEWKRQIGYEEHEIPGRYEEWEKRLHPEDRPGVLAEVEAYLKGQCSDYNVEFRLRHKDGSYVWIKACGEVNQESKEDPQRFTGCHLDITQYKKLVQALDVENKKFQTMVDKSPIALFLIDREAHSLHINPRFIELFGYDLNAIPTRKDWFKKAYPNPDYRREVLSSWHQRSEGDNSRSYPANIRKIKCNDGTVKLARVSGTLLANGEQVFAYEDITDQEHLEEELRKAQKMEAIATLAGGIAHDFNNILTLIMGHAELAKQHLPADNHAMYHVTEILGASNRAKQLTQHILGFSRRSEDKLVPLSPHLVVKEVLGLLRPTLPATIEIRHDMDPTGIILGDYVQIHQVIMNLCTNAYQAMRGKVGVLEIGLHNVTLKSEMKGTRTTLAPGNYVRLTVSDMGIGIPCQSITQIFDPYFTTKSLGEGTGLGLAVVYEIVKRHNGAIDVQSEIGKGTVFQIYFPLLESAVESEKAVLQEEPLPTGDERILVVEDEYAIAILCKNMLEMLGYYVVVSTSGIEALELFKGNPEKFDLVISDMTMPRITGAELAKEIMRIRPNIPIVLCTGFSTDMSEEIAKKMGIQGFIMKPYVARDIANVIRQILDQHQSGG
jgi:PAS domain S-box-containing protein